MVVSDSPLKAAAMARILAPHDEVVMFNKLKCCLNATGAARGRTARGLNPLRGFGGLPALAGTVGRSTAIDEPLDLGNIHGFDEMVIEAGAARFGSIGFLPPAA
jgi:hypothetical protein